MTGVAGIRGLFTALAVVLAWAVWVPGAHGAHVVGPQNPDDPQGPSSEKEDGWQAGTCTDDPEPPAPPTDRCSVETPELFFETAAGHPPIGFTQIIVNKEEVEPLPLVTFKRPVDALRDIRVDIPPGFSVNPQAVPWCKEESPEKCKPESQVGISIVEATNPSTGTSVELPPVAVHNLEPEPGEPARFGFTVAGNDVILQTGVTWEDDYHQHFTIHAHEVSIDSIALEALGLPTLGLEAGEIARIAKNRLSFFGDAGNGTFLTTPPTCFGPSTPGSPFEQIYSTWLRAEGESDPPNPNFPNGVPFVQAKIPPGTSPKECDTIPFNPSIAVNPNTPFTDSPSGAHVTVELPEVKDPAKEGKQATSHVRSASVSLPPGMGLNPSAANGLVACTDAQFGKGTRNPVACPPASRVGTVEVDTPPLPDGSLTGAVYVGQQLSRDPLSGDLYRIFVTVESSRFDISARLLGRVLANPVTGQVTNVFTDAPLGKVPIPGLPQVPFKSFRFKFDGGPRAPLTSPPTCGPNTTHTQMTPWSGNPPATPGAGFALPAQPGGAPCAQTLAERPFAPHFTARTNRWRAAVFSPFTVEVGRFDGNQELKGVEVTLPTGLSAKLAGVRYCPPAAIAAAAANAGQAEAAASSCPQSSLVGVADVAAGSGPAPIQISGKAFLAGPYRGAPLSLVVITPATAGPYDLGSVVSRVALRVHPETAQVTAVSDPLPHVYGGALLNLRQVTVRMNRPRFMLNPTKCAPKQVAATLRGGGADPNNPAAFAAHGAGTHFRVAGCGKLAFKPRFFLRLFGAQRRAKNPKLRAVVVPRKGNANFARAAVILPRALILDQGNLAKVCTRVQFAANRCPKKSIYGHARAFSPLLDKPLRGRVYLRSSDNPLPDLVAALRGQVSIDLVGRTDSVRGRIRNTFDTVPDVPVSKFILTLRGGRKGLLVNSRDLCPRKARKAVRLRAAVRLTGQNSRRSFRKAQPVRTPCRR